VDEPGISPVGVYDFKLTVPVIASIFQHVDPVAGPCKFRLTQELPPVSSSYLGTLSPFPRRERGCDGTSYSFEDDKVRKAPCGAVGASQGLSLSDGVWTGAG